MQTNHSPDPEAKRALQKTYASAATVPLLPNGRTAAEQARIEQAAANMRALRKTMGSMSIEEILSARDEGRM